MQLANQKFNEKSYVHLCEFYRSGHNCYDHTVITVMTSLPMLILSCELAQFTTNIIKILQQISWVMKNLYNFIDTTGDAISKLEI